MEPSASSSSNIQQQLLEYRLKKQREAQTTSTSQSATATTPASPPHAPVAAPLVSRPVTAAEEEKKLTASENEDDSTWNQRQEEYKKGLLQGSIKPPKYKVYDFTKGSENEKRLKTNNYEFVPTGQVADPDYKKDDLKALHAAISAKKESKPVRHEASPVFASAAVQNRGPPPAAQRRYPSAEEEEEKQRYEQAQRENEAQVPLLRSFSDDERPITRSFLCFRNVNRDILGLLAIALLLACVIGFLFLISK